MVLYIDFEIFPFNYYTDDILSERDIHKEGIYFLLDNLIKIPEEIIKQIEEIVFTAVDMPNGKRELSKILKVYITNKKKSKDFLKVEHLFKKNKYKILNSSDEYFSISQDKQFIFFDTCLTIKSTWQIVRLKNICGYRKIIKKGNIDWEIITDIDKYLAICFALYFNNIEKDVWNKFYQPNFTSYILDSMKVFDSGECNKFRFAFLDEIEDNFIKFIADLQKYFGQMFIVDCIQGKFVLPKGKEKLLILNVDKLENSVRRELYQQILTLEYKDRLVIIVDSIPEELIGYPQFHDDIIMPITTVRELDPIEICLHIVRPVIKEIDKTINNFKTLIDVSIKNDGTKKKIFNYLETSKFMGLIFDSNKVNFWYNLELVPTVNWKQSFKNYDDKFHRHFSKLNQKEIKNFIVLHDTQKKLWVIKKNGQQIKEISYSRSKGMRYVVYLAKHYRKKTISDSDLRNIIDKWYGKGTKTAEVSTDAKKILQDLKYLFEFQCPELEPLNDCIVISSKDPGCHFRTIDNVSLEISDEDIPDPIY